jgi:nucleoside-diphosphate-sugar epimerase
MKKKILLCGANGYVGSLFYKRYHHKYDIFPIDNLLVKKKKFSFVKIKDYKNLDENFLDKFDICVWLCGHASVQQCSKNPEAAFQNNTVDLIELKKKFSKNKRRGREGTFIYSSTGSLYNNLFKNKNSEEVRLSESVNMYDLSKSTLDKYFSLVEKNFICLRFGTVVGASPSFKNELLLNRMSQDAIIKKKIFVANPENYRSILYIVDLVKSLEIIIENHKDLRNEIFNLCSINGTIGNFANCTSNFYKVKILKLANSPSYSYQMSNSKFKSFTKFVFTTDIDEILNNIRNYLLYSKF